MVQSADNVFELGTLANVGKSAKLTATLFEAPERNRDAVALNVSQLTF